MSASSVSSPFSTSGAALLTPSVSSQVKWSELTFQEAQNHEMALLKYLKGTNLFCTISMEGGQWDYRKKFIDAVAADIIANCPKDEPLVLVSLGADRLLMEYILGKTLIENGFHQISFYLVDPAYLLSSDSIKEELEMVRNQFRALIEVVYLKSCGKILSKEEVRFFSRGINIQKYFPKGANVALIESYPPYQKTVKDLNAYQVEQKLPEDLMAGGYIVEVKDANAVAFMPASHLSIYEKNCKLYGGLPTALLPLGSDHYLLDWGCKIRSDGSYRLSFSAEKEYPRFIAENVNKPLETKIEIVKGIAVQIQEWVSVTQEAIKKDLDQQMAMIKKIRPGQSLSQSNITELLKRIVAIASKYMPGIGSFYTADYSMDREEVLSFLAFHAGHHYRRTFLLMADFKEDFRMTTPEILT